MHRAGAFASCFYCPAKAKRTGLSSGDRRFRLFKLSCRLFSFSGMLYFSGFFFAKTYFLSLPLPDIFYCEQENMRNSYIRHSLFCLFLLFIGKAPAQIRGVVTDSLTNEKLSYISVYYDGKGVGSITDNMGYYHIETRDGWTELTFSAMGYVKKKVKIIPGTTKRLNVKLVPDDIVLSEIVVKPKRERYKKKNNPAVEMMKKVIAAKKKNSLDDNDYYRYDKYEKITMALNDMTPERLEKGAYKNLPFLANQVETDEETNQPIVPISVQETASEILYRKDPKTKKTFVRGTQSTGIDNLFDVGNVVTEIMQEVFADVNIYDNNIYLLKKQFVSPISDNAVSFYKYYIMDTLYVENDKCFHLSFVPQNSQDFGFTGHLYVLADSSYAVKRCTMQLPKHTGVNFVENLKIAQEYGQLPDGERTVIQNDMSTDIYPPILKLQGVKVKKTTRYSRHSFAAIPEKDFGNSRSKQTAPDALMKDSRFWEAHRQLPLTQKEESMSSFVKEIENAPNLRFVLFALRLFVENYVGTGSEETPSKVDVGPLSTIVSSNYIDGMRLRFGATTTANFNPHLFLKGYYAYGMKDHRSKYNAEMEYSFEKKAYMPFEYPRNSLSVAYQYDVQAATDKFLTMDKDNMFNSIKTSKVDQMSYIRKLTLKYEYEAYSGFSTKLEFRTMNDEPTGKLYYIRNDGNETPTLVHDINTTEFALTLRYAPGEEYVNSKQQRSVINRNAPVFTLTHTMGVKNLFGGDYDFNLTEFSIFKRLWLSSWGRMDIRLRVGAQWNKVPFPLLSTPPANYSFFLQDGTFNLMNNLEFLNDRYASLDLDYDLNGKLLNRIPLLHRLKWREHIGAKILYGDLTEKNNPDLRPGDANLFLFPKRNGHQSSFAMESNKPYIEIIAGIHNIFKLFQIEYVRRLTYLDHPDISKSGIRLGIKFSF